MPDLTHAPPMLGSSKGPMQSQRGGQGRFNPIARRGRGGGSGGDRRGRGRGGGAGRGRSDEREAVGPGLKNVQHPGHIPGSLASRPLNGVFAIDKPSGPPSMLVLEKLKDLLAYSPLFRNPDGSVPEGHGGKAWRPRPQKDGSKVPGKAGPPKVGQGGTLDPLASGVLVVGIGTGTKNLQNYLDCAKTYTTTGLLGASTTSYDSQDPIVTRTPHTHVNEDLVKDMLHYFTGPLLQYPPLYSAVKMDGKRLLDYARANEPLPRPIESREIEILEMKLLDWVPAQSHSWKYPEQELPEEEKKLLGRVREMAGKQEGEPETVLAAGGEEKRKEIELKTPASGEAGETQEPSSTNVDADVPPAAFKLRTTVSSGTYVRSLVHDVGLACSSTAHVVELRRTRQSEWITQDEADRLASLPSPEPNLPNDQAASSAEASQGGIQLELKDGLDEAASAEVADSTTAEDASTAAVSVTQDAPLPNTVPTETIALPWSLFEEAHEAMRAESDPNARNYRHNNKKRRSLKEVTEDDDMDADANGGGEEVEADGGLKKWEKELLRVIQPC